MTRNRKFTQENAKTIVRALTGMREACLRASEQETTKKWKLICLKQAQAYTHALAMIEQGLGIVWEPYGDEEEIASDSIRTDNN